MCIRDSLLREGALQERLDKRYSERHNIVSAKELGAYVQELKARFMRNAPPLAKVLYDDKLHVVRNALGLHTTLTRSHGSRVQKRREIRISALFKQAAPEFLRMIVVHELAHMKHANHDRDFYALCTYMDPDYHQIELDLRLWLTARDWSN